ncbi:hypothetical protein SRHO_G00306690 [Serrasalmus rhombeus]
MSSNTGIAALGKLVLDLKAHLGANDQQSREYADTVCKLARTALAQFRSTHRELENAHEQAASASQASQKQSAEKARLTYQAEELAHLLLLRTESELVEVKFKIETAQQQQINSESNFTYVQREPEFSRGVNYSQTTELGSYPDLAEPVSPQPLHQPWRPLHTRVPSDGDLDKIARNITYFEPMPEGSNDIHSYLKDIDYYLHRFPNATVEDKIYLIRRTSSQEVSQFIERQSNSVRSHYDVLCQALIEEFSNHLAQTGLVAALAVKQHRRESPQQYYSRLRLVYFGSQNELGMEENIHFNTLFVRNLHPTTSHYLGIAACPQTLSSRQLHDLALNGFAKHLQALSKRKEAPKVNSLDTQGLFSALSQRQGTP